MIMVLCTPASLCLPVSKDRWLWEFPTAVPPPDCANPNPPGSPHRVRSPHLTDHLGDPWMLLPVNIILALCIPKLDTLCEIWSNQWWVRGNNQFKWPTASDCVCTAQDAPNLCCGLLLPCVYQLTTIEENSKIQISSILFFFLISAVCKCNWSEQNYFELLKTQGPYIIKVRRLIKNNNPFSHTYFILKHSVLSFFLIFFFRILFSHSLRTSTWFLKVYKEGVKWITNLLYNQQ